MLVRCFVAVEISPPEVVQALVTAQADLRKTGVDAKWVPPAQFHLTLKFLGETAQNRVPAALTALCRAAERSDPFGLELEGLGCFPNVRSPRVLWAGIAGGARALEELAGAVEKEMEIEGFTPEQRRFHAHLTLARVREGAEIPDALGTLLREGARRQFGRVEVSRAVLMKSELRPGGPVYTPIGIAPMTS